MKLKHQKIYNKTAIGTIHRTLGWFVKYRTDKGLYGEMPMGIWNSSPSKG